MAKRHRFRKMYFICEDNIVIQPNVHATTAYQRKDVVDNVCRDQTARKAHTDKYDLNYTPPKLKVEGFYLVHESLYDKLLSAHDKDSK